MDSVPCSKIAYLGCLKGFPFSSKLLKLNRFCLETEIQNAEFHKNKHILRYIINKYEFSNVFFYNLEIIYLYTKKKK